MRVVNSGRLDIQVSVDLASVKKLQQAPKSGGPGLVLSAAGAAGQSDHAPWEHKARREIIRHVDRLGGSRQHRVDRDGRSTGARRAGRLSSKGSKCAGT